jgi:hypothetical protein
MQQDDGSWYEDLESLKLQLKKARENRRLIQEGKGEYVMAQDIPPEIRKSENHWGSEIARLEKEIAEIKQKQGIRDGEPEPRIGGTERKRSMIPWVASVVGALVVLLVGGALYWYFQPTPIEAFPHYVATHSGLYADEVGNGRGTLETVSAEPFVIDHKLRSSIEGDRYGYAGLSFYFYDDLDLSPYEAVTLVMSFEDNQVQCDFGIKDSDDDINYVRNIGASQPGGQGVTVSTNGNRQEIRVPLAGNFEDVNLTRVKELSCTTHTDGEHAYIIHDVLFIKK